MFLSLGYSGYNRHGEQSSAGQFLILMQPNYDSLKYPAHSTQCAKCGKTRGEHGNHFVPSCPDHGIVARIRALDAAKHSDPVEYERLREAWGQRLPDERYTDGCAACAAHKAYAANCNTFQLQSIHYPLRAIVRYVRMRQLGHFMMGVARIGAHRIVLSGAYGSDGLPKSVPDEVYEAGTELPDTLYKAWANGGGWNSTGSEREAMAKWAKENLIPLKARRRDVNKHAHRDRKAYDLNRGRSTRYQNKRGDGEE